MSTSIRRTPSTSTRWMLKAKAGGGLAVRSLLLGLIVLTLPGCVKKSPTPDVVDAESLRRRLDVLEREVAETNRKLEGVLVELQRLEAEEAPDRASVSDEGSESIDSPPIWPVEYAMPDLYQRALDFYERRDFAKAESGFLRVTERYPNHGLASNALYWLGEIAFTKRHYNQAVLCFQDLLANYPKAHKVPDALLKLGRSREKLGQIQEAHQTYRKVIQDYPDSAAAKIARKWL